MLLGVLLLVEVFRACVSMTVVWCECRSMFSAVGVRILVSSIVLLGRSRRLTVLLLPRCGSPLIRGCML